MKTSPNSEAVINEGAAIIGSRQQLDALYESTESYFQRATSGALAIEATSMEGAVALYLRQRNDTGVSFLTDEQRFTVAKALVEMGNQTA